MGRDPKTILVVEDDARQRALLVDYLGGRGYHPVSAPDAESALGAIATAMPDLVLMDVRMPGIGGLEGLRRMRELEPALAVILITAYADVRDAVQAMKNGALDYLEKPVDLEELAAVVSETIGEPQTPIPAIAAAAGEGFVAASEAMRRVVAEASLVAPTDATVLVTGESGTGKERVAELVHRLSRRCDQPFVRINCAAIPGGLVESELFGHVRGAFTGATADRPGRFEVARGGTLLLDEVGDLPLEVQPKLLRVLEDGTFERIGTSVPRQADVRVIACTNRDLEKAVRDRCFREDLFWRLNVFRIHVPPLRQRREEIPVLARAFLRRGTGERVRLSPAAERVLVAWTWPGNVRELGNVLERAAILAAGGIIVPEHLPEVLRSAAPPAANVAGSGAVVGPVITVNDAERQAIRDALRHTGGNRTQAARILGISRRTLLYRLKQYGPEP